MRVYPKVPRYDHPTVSDDIYTATDLTVLEKLDGSNFRITLYEDQFEETYDFPTDQSFNDGDVLFGSKKAIRGHIDQPLSAIDGSFHRAVKHLRDTFNPSAFRSLQSTYGPLTIYAENMVPHTLDYDYESDPPPALLGFDVYAARDGPDTIPSDPFEDDFTGFLPLEDAWSIIRSSGLTPVPVLEGPGDLAFDPQTYTVPASHYMDGQAEGVVIRSDSKQRRVKLVTDEFEELNKQRWGKHEADAEDGSELAVVRLCSDARIRKVLTKLVQDHGIDPESKTFVDALAKHTHADMWSEEWYELKEFNEEINPTRMQQLVRTRCEELYSRDRKTAELNDVPLTNVWKTARQTSEASTLPTPLDEAPTLSEESETPLLDEYVTDEFLQDIIHEIRGDEDLQRSMINEIYTEAYNELWRRNWNEIAVADISFTPTEVRHRIAERTAAYVTKRA